MHVLRLLRIFIPLLIVAALVAGTVLVFTSRSELQRSHKQVESAWTRLESQLSDRFQQLSTVNAAADIPGPLHVIATDVDTAYGGWKDLDVNGGNLIAQVD